MRPRDERRDKSDRTRVGAHPAKPGFGGCACARASDGAHSSWNSVDGVLRSVPELRRRRAFVVVRPCRAPRFHVLD